MIEPENPGTVIGVLNDKFKTIKLFRHQFESGIWSCASYYLCTLVMSKTYNLVVLYLIAGGFQHRHKFKACTYVQFFRKKYVILKFFLSYTYRVGRMVQRLTVNVVAVGSISTGGN